MRRYWSTAAIALTALAVTACDTTSETMTDEEIEQVLDRWSQPDALEKAPQERGLHTPDGRFVALPSMASEPEQLSGYFLVILASSDTPGHMPESLLTLVDHPDLLAGVRRASSSWFEALMPCYEITVAGGFEYRRQATALARQLDELGIDNYVKQAGRYVGPQAVVEAWCASDKQAQSAGCGQLRFAEVHDGRAWLWLAQDPLVIERALEGAAAPTPLGGLTAWSTGLGAETIEPHDKGDAWRVYAPGSATELGTCRINGFAAITRGQPHFGYLAQEPPPTAPGCGEPALFAELSCKEAPDEPLIALPADQPEPALYTALAPLRDIELEDDIKVIVAKSEAFGPVFRQANAEANERSVPLQQLVTLRGYVAKDRKVLLVQVTLQTGDGEVWCGSDDVRADLVAVYDWTKEGGIGEQLVPFYAIEMSEVIGLIDLEGDGTPELIQQRWPDELQVIRAGQATTCTAPQAYCDCPC